MKSYKPRKLKVHRSSGLTNSGPDVSMKAFKSLIDKIQTKKINALSAVLHVLELPPTKETFSRITRVISNDNQRKEQYFLDHKSDNETFLLDIEMMKDENGDFRLHVNAPIDVSEYFNQE